MLDVNDDLLNTTTECAECYIGYYCRMKIMLHWVLPLDNTYATLGATDI